MCTAVCWNGQSPYFGRNLDLPYGYHETVTVTPRNYSFHFRHLPEQKSHHAMIGMATVAAGYPLYYEATNEFGLSMAGLNFPGLAQYNQPITGMDNVASFELIPWVLGQCSDINQAQQLLVNLNITCDAFSDALPPTPLHWILADQIKSITLEATKNGLQIYDNPIGILTNNPTFDYHMYHLCDYMQISSSEPENRFAQDLQLTPYSTAMGSIGLPGDFSSASRFVRAAFIKLNSPVPSDEECCISHFFRILGSVAMPRGSIQIHGENDITRYSCCCNTKQGIYYYTTYDNPRITGVNMHHTDLDSTEVMTFPLLADPDIRYQN